MSRLMIGIVLIILGLLCAVVLLAHWLRMRTQTEMTETKLEHERRMAREERDHEILTEVELGDDDGPG